MHQHFKIIGSARYLPRVEITADELDRRLGLSPGWTLRHTGVEIRFQAIAPENALTMACEVVTQALASACRDLTEIDLIIDASLCIQQPIPSNAALIARALGSKANGIPAIDVHASCLGFVAALQMANGLCAAGTAQRVLIVCSETSLQGVNWDEPESACLMGDGAAAVVVEACAPCGPCTFALQTFAEHADLCVVKGGGHRMPFYDYTAKDRAAYLFHMDGKAVHKVASRRLPSLVTAALKQTGCSLAELQIVPHQASRPALEFMARRLKIPRECLHTSLENHGNLIAAGIPFVLHAVRGKFPPGTPVMLVGTAAGYMQGVAIITL